MLNPDSWMIATATQTNHSEGWACSGCRAPGFGSYGGWEGTANVADGCRCVAEAPRALSPAVPPPARAPLDLFLLLLGVLLAHVHGTPPYGTVDVQPVLSHTPQDLLELWRGPATPAHVAPLQVLLPTRVQPRHRSGTTTTAWTTAAADHHRLPHP